jgi:hypothetical protein
LLYALNMGRWHAVCTKRRTCSRSEYAIWQDRSLSVGDDVRIRT